MLAISFSRQSYGQLEWAFTLQHYVHFFTDAYYLGVLGDTLLARGAHHRRLPPPRLSARLSPGPHQLTMEAAPDRLHPLAPPRGHRHPLLRLDDPARRPRPHQRDPGAARMDHQAAAPHVQQVRGDPRPRARLPPLHGAVPHRCAQAHRAPAHRGLPDPGGLSAPGLLRGDAAPVAARHPRRLPPRLLLAISSFVVPILVGGFKVHVLPMVVYEQVLSVFDWPFGAANAFVLLVISVVLIGVYIKVTGARAPGHRVILRARGRADLRLPHAPHGHRGARRLQRGQLLHLSPQGFSLKWFANFFQRREFMQALWLSTELAVWTALASTVIGTAAALPLVRGRFRGPGSPQRVRDLAPAPAPDPHRGGPAAVLHALQDAGLRTRRSSSATSW